MICPKCGKENTENIRWCCFCGALFEEESASYDLFEELVGTGREPTPILQPVREPAAKETVREETPAREISDPQPPQRGSAALWVFLVLALLLFAFAACMLFVPPFQQFILSRLLPGADEGLSRPSAPPAAAVSSAPLPADDGLASVYYETGSSSELSGAVTEALSWRLENGILTISGAGPIPDYPNGGAPWAAIMGQITGLVLEEGVTAIGAYAFADCAALRYVVAPVSLTAVAEGAFKNCSALRELYYRGTEQQLLQIRLNMAQNPRLTSISAYYNSSGPAAG